MKKINKVTEDIDVIGSSKLTATRIKTIISIVLMVAVFVIGFNLRLNTANDIELNEIESSVTTTGNMTTTASTTSSITTTTTTMNTTSSTTAVTTVVTTEETTEEECIITMPVNIQVYVEPAYEEPTVVEEPVIEETINEEEPTEDTSSNEESTDPPIVEEEPLAVEETEPLSMTYIGNLYITGYVATGNPTASGPYPYVGGVAMSRSYGFEWGTTIYIDGLGYYTLFDTGCSYGVVDVFCNTEPECYALTSWRDVYVVN